MENRELDFTVTKTCIECKKNYDISLNKEDYNRFLKGEHIQHAMPYISEDNRELLLSGICGKCFDIIFADEDETDF